MRNPPFAHRLLCAVVGACLGTAGSFSTLAQDATVEPTAPAAAAAKGKIDIAFTPPPMDGTFSIGVYSADQRLVRVLHSEASEDVFAKGLNGLITSWDGRDDAGAPLPAGKYRVKGFCVGELEIEGQAYWGNDWFADEAHSRLKEFGEMRVSDQELRLTATTVDGKHGVWTYALATEAESFVPDPETEPTAGAEPTAPPPLTTPGEWTIETVDDENGQAVRLVVQRRGDDVLRALEIAADQPQPVAVAAVPGRDEIFLSERGDQVFRVRGLRLKETISEDDGSKVSNWEIFFTKTVWKSDAFPEIKAALDAQRKAPFQPQESARIRLVANPLEREAARSLELGVLADGSGSHLRTADGLPLRTVTNTPHLKWAVIAPAPEAGSRGVVLLQSDGAVIEEFRVGRLSNMMAFDAGEYEWAGVK